MKSRLRSYWRLHNLPILLVLLCLGCYYVFAYLLHREDTLRLLGLYAAVFFICFKLIQFEKWNLRFLVGTGILFRLVFLFAIPNLSQDFYRFLWDGRMLLEGFNPYSYRPDEVIEWQDDWVQEMGILHDGMGELSARHFSNYPPFNQFCFALAVLLGGKSILGSLVAMRVMILAADLGILYFGRRLLMRINRSPYLIFWYFLNPLVIIELSGNLHFEGVMLCFFLWAVYLATAARPLQAGILYGISIGTKLITLMFLPLFYKSLGLKKSLYFWGVTLICCLVAALPFLESGVPGNYAATLTLWFTKFEFNSGLYKLVMEMGNQFGATPWKLVRSYSKFSAYLLIGLIAVFALMGRKQNPQFLLSAMMWTLAIYYLMSSTVHPWYIIPLVLLCIFTDFRFPLFWSATVMLSYAAYAQPDYKENIGLIALEYFVVIGMMSYEIIRMKGNIFSYRKN